mgnify:CR=1 FL=1
MARLRLIAYYFVNLLALPKILQPLFNDTNRNNIKTPTNTIISNLCKNLLSINKIIDTLVYARITDSIMVSCYYYN